jgi:regulator of nucleoside diphosphate kinase
VKSRSIVVTDADMDRLTSLIRALRHSFCRDQQQLDLLDQVLQSAEVRAPSRTPKSVVRMNSSVRVRDFDTGKEEVYTLVFPEETNISIGLVSVLAPVAVALLGRRKGEVIQARVPGGIRRLKIEQVQHRPDDRNRKLPLDRPINEPDLNQETGLAA